MPLDHSSSSDGLLEKNDPLSPAQPTIDDSVVNYKFKADIVWKNVAYLSYFHLAALYGLYLSFTSAKLATVLFAFIFGTVSGLGVTCGAHRLWSHRCFKANLGLRVFLMILNSMSFQNCIFEWARDHRVHHKFTDTNADPYNIKRGFFFSHIGWLLIKKHPEVIQKGKGVDVSDLLQDPVVVFQRKYYLILMPLICFALPTALPVLLWSETCSNAYHVAVMLRYVILLNNTWLVNSAAHTYGNKPYDKNMEPRDNVVVAILALGEGWHNYHHVFPWDYRAAELGSFRFNYTTRFIDFCAKMGWAYDLKSTSLLMVQQRANRTGDGTREQRVWGWGDSDMAVDEHHSSIIDYKKAF